MRFFTLCILLFSATKIFAHPPDTMHWNGPNGLSFKEFKAEPIEGFSGEIFCLLTANFEKSSPFQKSKFSVTNYFDRSKSWFNRKDSSEQLLLYSQLSFNIYEVHARNLRKVLSETKFKGDPNKLFNEKYNAAFDSLMNEYNEFRKDTRFGTDENALEKWKIRINEELNTLSAFTNDLH